MDGMKKKGIKFFISFTTGMIIGMLLGASIISVFVSYRIDKYLEKITYLESTIEDKDIRLKKLEDTINSRRFILKEIDIIIEYDGDDLDEITLVKHIKEKYSSLLGKEVKSIDVDMVNEIIDQRIMKIDEKEYRLNVSKLVLSEILRIWIEVTLIEENSNI